MPHARPIRLLDLPLHLQSALSAKGFTSIGEFQRTLEPSYASGYLRSLLLYGYGTKFTKKGAWTKRALRAAALLERPVEELFSPELFKAARLEQVHPIRVSGT